MKRVGAEAARGFAMGAADLVPGVSGATVAFVTGIYERLVTQLRLGVLVLGQLARLRLRAAANSAARFDWRLLASVLGGVAVALITLARPMRWLIDSHSVYVSAAFFGLVAAAAVAAARSVETWRTRTIGAAAAVTVAAFVALGLRADVTAEPGALALFGAGAVAICATVLPGVSGSFVLLMFGVYEPFIDALAEADVAVIAALGAGAAVGLVAFAPLLARAVEAHRDLLLALMAGLLAGSLRVLWPWPATGAPAGALRGDNLIAGHGNGASSVSGVENAALGPPEVTQLPLALALAAACFAAVIAAQRRRPTP